MLITYTWHGKESQSVSPLCFHDHLALINKHKKECLGISLVPGKEKHKAVEAEWQVTWIDFEKDVSVLESKEKRIMTILFGWYFHLASVQFLLYVFDWLSSLLIFLNVTQYEWHFTGFVYLFKTFDLWKQSKTFAFPICWYMRTCLQLWVKKALFYTTFDNLKSIKQYKPCSFYDTLSHRVLYLHTQRIFEV